MEQTRTVLLVDDAPFAVFIAETVIGRSGTGPQVLTARHGQEALAMKAALFPAPGAFRFWKTSE